MAPRGRRTAALAILCGLAAMQQAAALAPNPIVNFAQLLVNSGGTTWTVTNVATPTVVTVNQNQPTVISYTTTYTQSPATVSQYQVGGELTLSNPDPSFPMTIGSVQVQLVNMMNGAIITTAPVANCGPITVSPNALAPSPCQFNVFGNGNVPPNGVGVIAIAVNQATGESGTSGAAVLAQQIPGSGGTTNNPCASITYAVNAANLPWVNSGGTPPPNGQQLCASQTFFYQITVNTPFCGTFPVVNTASVFYSGQTQAAPATTSVNIQCGGVFPPPPPPVNPVGPLTVSTTAVGTALGTNYTWNVLYNSNVGSLSVKPNTNTNVNFTISVTRSIQSASYQVAGTITIFNPNPVQIQVFSAVVRITGTVMAPYLAVATCSSYLLQPGQTVQCSWTAPYSDGPAAGFATASVQTTTGTTNSPSTQFNFASTQPGNDNQSCAVLSAMWQGGKNYLLPVQQPAGMPPSFGMDVCNSQVFPFRATFRPTTCGNFWINSSAVLDPVGPPVYPSFVLIPVSVTGCPVTATAAPRAPASPKPSGKRRSLLALPPL